MEEGTGVHLVKEDVFPIPSLGGKVFQIAILADTVLLTQLLPELTANWLKVSTLRL